MSHDGCGTRRRCPTWDPAQGGSAHDSPTHLSRSESPPVRWPRRPASAALPGSSSYAPQGTRDRLDLAGLGPLKLHPQAHAIRVPQFQRAPRAAYWFWPPYLDEAGALLKSTGGTVRHGHQMLPQRLVPQPKRPCRPGHAMLLGQLDGQRPQLWRDPGPGGTAAAPTVEPTLS